MLFLSRADGKQTFLCQFLWLWRNNRRKRREGGYVEQNHCEEGGISDTVGRMAEVKSQRSIYYLPLRMATGGPAPAVSKHGAEVHRNHKAY